MENTIASAKQATDEIKGEADTQSQESSGSDTGGKSSFWSGLVDKVEDTVTGAKVNLENTLNRFIEAIAVMLVTSCVIPILVLLFFVWLVKLVLGVNITLPQIGKRRKREKNMKLLMKQRVFHGRIPMMFMMRREIKVFCKSRIVSAGAPDPCI